MAIGIDASRAFSAHPTGIGVYATEVCRGLIEQPPAPLLLYHNSRQAPKGAPPLAPGSEWRLIPLTRGWTALRLRVELRRRPPELLFIPAYRLPGGRLPRSVVTVHGVEHRLAPQAYADREARAVESFVRDTLARADRVIAPSETTRSDLVHLYQADPRRIAVIPHGVGGHLHPRPEAEVAAAVRARGIPGPYLLVVGAHHPRKNIGFLIRAFSLAFAQDPTGPWLVVANASGAAAQRLRAVAAQEGVGERVLLLPHLDLERVGALYCGALATCVPSLYEGFGLPALESMACGTPVLASDVGGVQEVASGAALLVTVGAEREWVEALRRLVSDRALREHLSGLGRLRAAQFSWRRSVDLHRRLLEEELALARDQRR